MKSWNLCLAALPLYASSLLAAPTITITVGVGTDTPTNIMAGGIYSMGSPGGTDLRGALNQVNSVPNAGGGYLINFQNITSPIQIGAMLPILNLIGGAPLMIDGGSGAPVTIDGAGQFRGFFACNGTVNPNQGTVTLNNLQIQNVKATGGNGGQTGGGAGMGAGAGLFVQGGATVNLSNVKILTASCLGGTGGPAGSGGRGGGGGMGGNGGNGSTTNANGGGGGGGLGGIGGAGIATMNGAGGGGGGINCGASHTGAGATGTASGAAGGGVGGLAGGNALSPSNGGAAGGGGGSNPGMFMAAAGGGGGVGGGNVTNSFGADAGIGGFGGGSGGSGAGQTAIGGYGGGSGGGVSASSAGFGGGCGNGLAGPNVFPGFGGGGNGSSLNAPAVGGGNGFGNVGGGGAGFGGGLFVDAGGVLNIVNAFSTSGNTVAPGTGAFPGWSAGADAFFLTGSTVVFDPNGAEIIIPNSIADDSASSFVGITPGTNAGSASGASITMGNPASQAGTVYFPNTNSSTYSGQTLVQFGSFRLDGSIVSPVTVSSGAVFHGVGTVNNTVLVNAGGTIHAGNSIGTLTMGSLTLESGAILSLDIDLASGSNSSSVYVVNGPLALNNATLQLNFTTPGLAFQSHTYAFIEYEGSNPGTFGSITLVPGFQSIVTYAPNLITLKLVPSTFIPTEGIPLTPNQRAFLNYLTALGSIPAYEAILADLATLSPNALMAALDSMSPARNAAATYFANQSAFGVSRIPLVRLRDGRIMNRMISSNKQTALSAALTLKQQNMMALADSSAPIADTLSIIETNELADDNSTDSSLQAPAGSARTMAAKSERYAFWGAGFGDFLSQDAQNSNPKIEDTAAGVLVGCDYYGYQNGIFNVSTGYIHNDISEGHQAGSGTSNGWILSAYGTGYLGNGYLEGGLLTNYNRFKMQRHIQFGGPLPFDETAKSSFNNWLVMPHLGGGYDWTLNWAVIEPFASLDWAVSFQGGYQERGAAPLNNKIKSKEPSILRSQIGANFYETWDKEKYAIIFQQAVSYINKAVFNTEMRSSLIIAPAGLPAGAPFSFAQMTYDKTLNLGSVSAEVFYKHKPSKFFFSASYEGEFGTGYVSNHIAGTFGVFW